MEKSQEEEMNSSPLFIHSTDITHLNYGQNTDGSKILACLLFCRPSTKKEN